MLTVATDVKTAGLTALLALVALTVSLGLGELVLRLFTSFPISEDSNMQGHPDLLYTADPTFPGIDPNGFRNPRPLKQRYDVVAIGDSHTYGSNAEASGTWPAQFASSTGLSTYSMGMGGYSVYQYDVLFDMALRWEPRQIVVALYPANDWMPDCALLWLASWQARTVREGLQPPCAPAAASESASPRPSIRGLVGRTAIGSALAVLVLEPLRFNWLPRLGLGRTAGPELVEFHVGGHEFSFGVSRLRNHSRGTDFSVPRVRAAYADGLTMATRWRDAAHAAGIDLAFAIIPSKEVVLRTWGLQQGSSIPEQLRRITENELAATRTLTADLQSLQIPFIDALPFVVAKFDEAVRAGESMYPPGLDGHPYESGYAAYAEAVRSLVTAPRIQAVIAAPLRPTAQDGDRARPPGRQ